MDPKPDVVFSLLFLQQPELLKQMVSAILAEPVDSITILNPEIPKELSQDKGIVLYIRVQLGRGKRVDVEMQSQRTATLTPRRADAAARRIPKAIPPLPTWGPQYPLSMQVES